jgi:hypothetical protein
MPFSSPWAILGPMKMFASVVALVLMGLTGGWLWMDATANGRQDAEGVVITGPVDPASATALLADPTGSADDAAGTSTTPGDEAQATRQEVLDSVVALLGASSDRLVARADEIRKEQAAKAKAEQAAQETAAKQAEEQRKADEKAAQEAEKAAEQARKDAERRATQPVPVQPAPIVPSGTCEWDDDDYEWDCDDDDDDDR